MKQPCSSGWQNLNTIKATVEANGLAFVDVKAFLINC
jgi:hypothetical protein